MVHYDHAMLGATIALALGVQRRFGWPAVALAALAGACPDWDATPKHFSPRTYQIAHRYWGHNLFAAALAGLAIGGVGCLIHRSRLRRAGEQAPERDGGVGLWLVLGVLIAWSHPLMDLLYCGVERGADWPVGLLWPVVREGFAVPWMPWSDWGATVILGGGLLLALAPRYRRVAACGALVLLGLYVGVRGALLRWS